MNGNGSAATPHRDYARGPSGRFVRTIQSAERDAEAARMRSRGLSYREIARTLGYSAPANAHKAVENCLREIRAPSGQLAFSYEFHHLDELVKQAWAILLADHPYVSASGKVVKDDTGVPVMNPQPKLQAIETLRKLSESRRKLMGTDCPPGTQQDLIELDAEIERVATRADAADGVVHRVLAVRHGQGRDLGAEPAAGSGDRFLSDGAGDAGPRAPVLVRREVTVWPGTPLTPSRCDVQHRETPVSYMSRRGSPAG